MVTCVVALSVLGRWFLFGSVYSSPHTGELDAVWFGLWFLGLLAHVHMSCWSPSGSCLFTSVFCPFTPTAPRRGDLPVGV